LVPRKPALGRGLKALIPDTPRARSGLAEIPVSQIRNNPKQPRSTFDPQALRELADSIKEHGILQPLLVSDDGQGSYLLVAGERRWRAAKLAGLASVPAVIRERLEVGRELELALVENLQRQDLTPIEEARAFENLRTTLGLSQAEISQRVGIDRSTVANSLRLLKLSPAIQELVIAGHLSAGHARTLLAFENEAEREHWARRAIADGLSVRALEKASSDARGDTRAAPRAKAKPKEPDPNIRAAEHRLSTHLGATVEIKTAARGAKIIISCASSDELMQLYERLMEEM